MRVAAQRFSGTCWIVVGVVNCHGTLIGVPWADRLGPYSSFSVVAVVFLRWLKKYNSARWPGILQRETRGDLLCWRNEQGCQLDAHTSSQPLVLRAFSVQRLTVPHHLSLSLKNPRRVAPRAAKEVRAPGMTTRLPDDMLCRRSTRITASHYRVPARWTNVSSSMAGGKSQLAHLAMPPTGITPESSNGHWVCVPIQRRRVSSSHIW